LEGSALQSVYRTDNTHLDYLGVTESLAITPDGGSAVSAISSSDRSYMRRACLPEVADDIRPRIGLLAVLLGRPLGQLERRSRVNGVGAICASCDLAAVGAMAECLA
jgi:hypothetical protein